MPQVGYQPISSGGILDLYSPYAQAQQNAQQLKLQRQQQQWGQIKDALPMLMKVFQAIQANKQLESMGIKTQVPEQKQFDEGTLNQFMANMGQFSPEAQAQLKGVAQEGHTYPTGKMKTEYDWSKLPAGAKYEDILTGMTYEGQQPKSQMTTIPEGFEVVGYTADGRPTVRKIKEEEKESYAESKRKALLEAVGRIESGEGNLRTELVNLQRNFPDVSLDTLTNLQDISKNIKKQSPKKQENETIRAIQMLRKKGYSEKEAKEYLGL